MGLDPEAPLVLYLGRLMERKRVVDLVRALPAIRVAVPGARLAIVGRRTSYLARVMAEVSALGVSEAVSVIEHVPHAEVPSVLGAADCFVLPSAYEGFPFTILEAMACGVPVVGTAIPGIVDQIVSGENGLLVPVARPAELATAISSLLADPVLAGRLAGAARERVEAAYTWEAVGAQHERLFEAVAA